MKEKSPPKKHATMAQYIEAVNALSDEVGFKNVTVRNVAVDTNYNSSNIYYYFENFYTLMSFVALRRLEGFFRELCDIEDDYVNCIDLSMRTFKAMISHLTKQPEVFRLLVMENANLREIMETYAAIYPDSAVARHPMFPIMKSDGTAEIYALDLCISHGYIRISSKYKLTELILSVTGTMIEKASASNDEERIRIEERFIEYIGLFVQFYQTPISMLSRYESLT